MSLRGRFPKGTAWTFAYEEGADDRSASITAEEEQTTMDTQPPGPAPLHQKRQVSVFPNRRKAFGRDVAVGKENENNVDTSKPTAASLGKPSYARISSKDFPTTQTASVKQAAKSPTLPKQDSTPGIAPAVEVPPLPPTEYSPPSKQATAEGHDFALSTQVFAATNAACSTDPQEASTRDSGKHTPRRLQLQDHVGWIQQALPAARAARLEAEALLDLPETVACLRGLVFERTGLMASLEDLTQELRRATSAADTASAAKADLEVRLEAREQDVAGQERRLRAVQEDHRAEKGRWATHRQELETLCRQLEHRDTQYRAALRKKETEYARLQEALQKSVSREQRSGRGLESTLKLPPVPLGDAAVSLDGRRAEAAEARADELSLENVELRQMVADLHGEFQELRGYQTQHEVLAQELAEEEASYPALELDTLPDLFEGMPVAWLRRNLGDAMAQQVLGMKVSVASVVHKLEEEHQPPGSPGNLQKQLEELRRTVLDCRALMDKQDELLRAAVLARDSGGDGGECGVDLDVSDLWIAKEGLDADKAALAAERQQLEKARADLIQQATEVDAAKFELSVHSDLRHLASAGTIMATPPNIKSGSRLTSSAARRGRLSFSPPEASPATAELLAALGVQLGRVSPHSESQLALSPIAPPGVASP